MATISIKLELKQSQARLDYHKLRSEKQPNHIDMKWVEIYSERVKKLERQLLRAQSKGPQASAARH